jgi:glycerophosphoryl diester phosphodiesterase
MPRNRSRIFHVKDHKYNVENSFWGIWLANLLGFMWMDIDVHATKDHVAVAAHWMYIKKDKFIIPPWFTEKYGRNPRIEDVLWEDLKKLKTKPTKYLKRTRRTQYRTVVQMARQIANTSDKLGMALECKGDGEFSNPIWWASLLDEVEAVGLPGKRTMVMTLSNIGHPYVRLKAARKGGWFPTVLLVRNPIPKEHLEDFDYWRGRAKFV